MAKTIFNMAAVTIGHLTVIQFQICCCVPNFIESVRFYVEIRRLTIFKMADVRHHEFYGSKNGFFDYWSSVETIAVNCLVFEKTAFVVQILATDRDRQTNEHMDSINA